MDKKEEELISMHYQMEKTDIKQQRLEDRLISISEDLKKSKRRRNFYFTFILVLMLLLTAGSLYVIQKENTVENKSLEGGANIQQLIFENDSLQKEVNKLKIDISKYQNEELPNKADSTTSLSDTIGDLNKGEEDVADGKSKLKFEKKYCYINKVYKSNGVVFIEKQIL